MTNIANIPYFEAEFDKNGKLVSAEPQLPAGTTDLYVISHGWNNSADEARELYTKLFTNYVEVAPQNLFAGKKPAIVGIIWPSKKFDEALAVEGGSSEVGQAGIGEMESDPKSQAEVKQRLDELKELFDTEEQKKSLDELKALIPRLDKESAARAKFVEISRQLVDPSSAGKEDASDLFFRAEPEDVMIQAKLTPNDFQVPKDKDDGGGAASFLNPSQALKSQVDDGGAVGIKDFFKGFSTAAMNVLNYTTYYEMKDRAGKVGKNGVAPLLDNLSKQAERIHLVGHSFGGRLVSAAASNSTTPRLRSMTLLQAAFSHNGFSKSMNGFFRAVVDKNRVNGPILVSYTKNDKAVGLAYPIASRLAGQEASAIGDANDKYGGIGRNGTQKMNPGESFFQDLRDVMNNSMPIPQEYSFKPGKFYNFEGKSFITGHGAVTGKQIAYLLACASLSQS